MTVLSELGWVTHSDGAMHLSLTIGGAVTHGSIQYRHDSDIWIAFIAFKLEADIWLHHADKQVLLDMVTTTLRLKGVID